MHITEIARDLRKNQTEAEKVFWKNTCKKQIAGIKFRRQYPIKFKYENKIRFFIADFYCPKEKLIIEIDGGIHKQQKDYDQYRDYICKELGYNVIRFTNEDIFENLETTLTILQKKISK